jgi:hypothetical protein
MGRNWLSIPIPGTRIRVGRSMSDAELFGTSRRRDALPSWRRFEIREHMQRAAKDRHETLSRERCDYLIDKALALGELDVEGNAIIHAKGADADELARQIIDGAAKWGAVISTESATHEAKRAINRIKAALRAGVIWRAIWVSAVSLAVGVWFYHSLTVAHAGTCRIYGEGTDTVEACDDGSYIVTDQHGHKRVYGEPNAGFERYPGQGDRPIYERRDWR